MGTGYKNRGSGAAGLGFKNRGAKLVEGAAYTNRGATDGVNEVFKNRGQAWGSDAYYNRGPNDFASLSVLGLAAFYAPLTSSLILTRGTGDPTYTRATVAWEFDNEGKLILVPSGAARFGGARMVRNLYPYSEATTQLSGTGSTITVASGVSWPVALTTSGIDITESLGGTNHYAGRSGTLTVGVLNLISVYATKKSNGRYLQFAGAGLGGVSECPVFNLDDGTVDIPATTTVFKSARIEHIESGIYRCSTLLLPTSDVIAFSITDSTTNNALSNYSGNGTSGVIINGIQVENVTGQADQTASEYVSVGVLAAPYHGAGVDGVKWFDTHKDGSAISESSLLGNHAEGARTNSLLHSRNLTNAAWAATNITPAKTATGIDNAANSASTLTAGAADATILQTLSLAAAARSFSAYVKRRTGTGSVYITRDGGTNWTDITSSLGASWTRVKIENTSVLNPSVGFKIATSGDAIDVDVCQDEAGAEAWSPIVTTTAAVTRNADAETFQTASNWSDTAGWALATVQGESWANATGTAIGNGTNGLKLSASNSGIVAYDGTNTVNGPAGSPSGAEKLAMTWGSGALQAASGGVAGTAGSYDGAWGLATIGIGTSQGNVYIKDVYIGQSALTPAQIAQVTA